MAVAQVEVPFAASPHLCEVLGACGKEKTAPKGSFLFHRGEKSSGVFVIRRGHVLVSIPAHQPPFQRTAGPSCILGLPGTMSGKPYSLTAHVDEETQFVFVDRSTILKCLELNSDLCFEVLTILSREVQALRDRL